MKLNENEIYTLDISNTKLLIRPFESSDSVSEITKLLHRSYKQLADMGFRYLATHQYESETERRLKNGISYIALMDSEIIGTVSLYYGKKKSIDPEWYRRKDVAYFGQFGIAPEYQKRGIGNCMMDIIEYKARQLGALELALDTAENAEHLIEYYQRRGYRFIEYVQWDVTNYRSVIMSKKLSDIKTNFE